MHITRSNIAVLLAATTLLVACNDNNGNNNFSLEPESVPIRTDALDSYARVDRTGQPAVATALLRRGNQPPRDGVPLNQGATNERDSFNRGEPAGDADFAGAFVDSLIIVNNALADDLDNLGLARCATGAPGSIAVVDQIATCVNQAAPVVIPDVITLNITAASSWPNGRHPDDPVVDRVLAAVLLDLGPGSGQGLDLFASLPLNPPGNNANANDSSPPNFPYLRDPL